VIQAAEAQLVPPAGPILRPYRRLRRIRGAGDYQASEGAVNPEDVEAAETQARNQAGPPRCARPTSPAIATSTQFTRGASIKSRADRPSTVPPSASRSVSDVVLLLDSSSCSGYQARK